MTPASRCSHRHWTNGWTRWKPSSVPSSCPPRTGSWRGRGGRLHSPGTTGPTWGTAEQWDRAASGARPTSRIAEEQPWLAVVRDVAARQGFFHWELEFAPVFGRGGFDLQVGNPPWVRPRGDVDALLAEFDPWWALAQKPSEQQRRERRDRTLQYPGAAELVLDGSVDTVATAAYVGSPVCYPVLNGLQPDFYRCFMAQTWTHASRVGTTGLIHLESHFTDEKAGAPAPGNLSSTSATLAVHQRAATLRNPASEELWRQHLRPAMSRHGFFECFRALSPRDCRTIQGAFRGRRGPPGFKDDDGHWDLRPHAERVVTVTDGVLQVWRDVLEESTVPVGQTRMLYTVNSEVAHVLATLAAAPPRVGDVRTALFSRMGRIYRPEEGSIRAALGGPPGRWIDAILQGPPHIYGNHPIYKIPPNPTMKNHLDWSAVDLESLSPTAVPVTAYKPAGDKAVYDAAYTHWDGDPARDHYRVAWRRMAANTGERTLIPALIPPGVCACAPPVTSAGVSAVGDLVRLQAMLGSLLADFSVRASPKGDIHGSTVSRLAVPDLEHPLWPQAALRTLRLNCVTAAYGGDLWRECWDPAYMQDSFVLGGTPRSTWVRSGRSGPPRLPPRCGGRWIGGRRRWRSTHWSR